MKNFGTFFVEAKETLRGSGISHVKDLKHEHLGKLLDKDTLTGHFKEKTDGMAFEIGHDEHGPYTRTSRSEKMRKSGDYEKAAKEKFGDDFDPSISQHFDRIHRELTSNPYLMHYLRKKKDEHGEARLSGEMFYKPHGSPGTTPGSIRFVGTSYDPSHMGSTGKFVVHTGAEANKIHNFDKLKKLGDRTINIDDDTVHKSPVRIDVAAERKAFHNINPEILASRKKADIEAKAYERQKLDEVKAALEKKLREHSNKFKPKWGPETEGHVFRKTGSDAPAVKLISNTFSAFKSDKQQSNIFGKK